MNLVAIVMMFFGIWATCGQDYWLQHLERKLENHEIDDPDLWAQHEPYHDSDPDDEGVDVVVMGDGKLINKDGALYRIDPKPAKAPPPPPPPPPARPPIPPQQQHRPQHPQPLDENESKQLIQILPPLDPEQQQKKIAAPPLAQTSPSWADKEIEYAIYGIEALTGCSIAGLVYATIRKLRAKIAEGLRGFDLALAFFDMCQLPDVRAIWRLVRRRRSNTIPL